MKQFFSYKVSSSSTPIADIKGIIFGGVNSRFWIYRKHMCCLDFNVVKNDTLSVKKGRRKVLPFYAWQCITLILENRSVDLVIKNEQNMDFFIQFLVASLNTIDGYKNTAQPLVISSYKDMKRAR